MKEILCFAKYAVKWRQAFNQRFLNRRFKIVLNLFQKLAVLGLTFFCNSVIMRHTSQGRAAGSSSGS